MVTLSDMGVSPKTAESAAEWGRALQRWASPDNWPEWMIRGRLLEDSSAHGRTAAGYSVALNGDDERLFWLRDRAGIKPAVARLMLLGLAVTQERLTARGQVWVPDPFETADDLAHPRLVLTVPITLPAFVPRPGLVPGELVCIDILALDLADGKRWATLTGDLISLPERHWPQDHAPEPIRLRRSPLSWLKDDCRGVVWFAKECLRPFDLAGREIMCEDKAHARAVLARIKKARQEALPPLPTMRVLTTGD